MTRLHVFPFLAIAFFANACTDRPAVVAAAPKPEGVVTLNDNAQRQAGITIARVETRLSAEQREAPGVVALDERHTARIGSLVEGILLETSAEVGDRVKSGQVLATMHSPAVHEAWAGYRKAIAERRHLEKELAFAVAADERARRLYADKVISLQEVQRAETNRVAAEEGLDIGRTEVRRSEEELDHLGIANADDQTGETGERIPIRTPTTGVVLDRLVTPGTAVTPGTPLYVVSDLSTLWALVEIDESLLSHVRVGDSIDVRVAAYPGEAFPGVVTFVGDVVNPKTRRVTVRCTLKNTDSRLKPQMYATAVIRARAAREVAVVPADAIQTIDGRPSVFVVEGGSRFRPRAIETGQTLDGRVDVRSGLQAGELIAASGSFVLKSELLKSLAPEE
jgi:cobalt-zinc-cadmium efflux system membrane fusion protein